MNAMEKNLPRLGAFALGPMEVLMNRLSDEAHSRSLAKAVTWRFTATIDTFVISLIVTGKVAIAGTIAATEIGTKILIYYFHERAWALISWGRRQRKFLSTS
jgi:uncharacterized membrane protein